MLPFSSFGRSCATQHRMGSRRIATRAARSRTPPTMPCRKSAIWQKKAAHRLPKTKSEPQRKARTESVPQHEQSRQPTTVPREYPPVSAQPSDPPQSQPQVSRSVRESASPIREKPVSPASDKQPKMREHTPTADAPVQQPQHTAPQIHENVKAVSTETTPSLTERSVREAVSPVKEKPVPPVNIPQPKMREYAPNADVPVHRPQHPDSRIHEGPQPVHQPQTNRSVRELETLVRKKVCWESKTSRATAACTSIFQRGTDCTCDGFNGTTSGADSAKRKTDCFLSARTACHAKNGYHTVCASCNQDERVHPK